MDKSLGLEARHYDEYFVVENITDEEYGWSVDVPLYLEGSYAFLYAPQSKNLTDIPKVHIPFGCVLLTRSDILHGGYGGSRGSLRLRGTFHTDEYDFVNNDVLERNYIAAKDGWHKFCLDNGSLDAKKFSKLVF